MKDVSEQNKEQYFINPEQFENPEIAAVGDADADAANMMKDLEALLGDARKEAEESEKAERHKSPTQKKYVT